MSQQLEPSKIAFNEICQQAEENNWILEECVLENGRNRKRQTITTFTLYFLTKNKKTVTKTYKMIDEQYLWLLSDLSREFPEALVIDVRQFKPGDKR